MTTAAIAISPPPKHIEVNGHRIHLREVQTVLWLVIGGLVAVYAVSGLYYALTQVHYYIWPGHSLFYLKHGWDYLFTQAWWPNDRHIVRSVIEGIFALPLLKWVAGNWKKHYDDDTISGWEIVGRLLLFLVVALGLMIAAIWFVTFGYEMITHHSLHVQYLTLTAKGAEYVAFATGLLIGQATHWIWRPAARDIQLYFTEASVNAWEAMGRIPFWIAEPVLPPALRERAAWMHDEDVPCRGRATWVRWGLPVITVVVLGLLGTGIYARHFA